MILSNSTPMINFSAIDRMDILQHLFGKIYIPSAVSDELFVKGKNYPSAEPLRKARFIEVLEVKNTMLADAFKKDLDAGEAEVIALSMGMKPELILLDEVAGRMIAEFYKISLTGSIGCLVEAKRRGIVSTIRPLLDDMKIKAGFWVNPKLYRRILDDNDE